MLLERDMFSERALKLVARLARETACEAYGVSHSDFAARRRGGALLTLARQTAMYLAHVVGQMTLGEIARLFGRDRSTVSHACINIEDRRDSPIFNMQLDYMEKRLRLRLDDARERGLVDGAPQPVVTPQITRRPPSA